VNYIICKSPVPRFVWCLLSKIQHDMMMSEIAYDWVRVMVFNAAFSNISVIL